MPRRAALVLLICALACGSSEHSATRSVDAGRQRADSGGDASPTVVTTTDAQSDVNESSVPAPDPSQPGPYAYTEVDDTTNVAASGDNDVPIHCAYPTGGPTAGPYPVVVVAHGLTLPASEYYAYVERLASFGYVALTVDFPSSVFSINNPAEAEDLLAGLDWAKGSDVVGAIADTSHSGMTGHSLGGKVALLAATMDARVKASIVLDPVDAAGGMPCTAPGCLTVAPMLASLRIPTGFLGETTDADGGVDGMPCAPGAYNYATFYPRAVSPSLQVTVLGAYHMSFLDDTSTCGILCSECTPGSASNAAVNGLAVAYVAAFYERYLRLNTGYTRFLTGSVAEARYVATNEATITSK